eukprot:518926-Pelagomonas_calceolata.AAC.2
MKAPALAPAGKVPGPSGLERAPESSGWPRGGVGGTEGRKELGRSHGRQAATLEERVQVGMQAGGYDGSGVALQHMQQHTW